VCNDLSGWEKAEEGVLARGRCPQQKGKVEESRADKEAGVRCWSASVTQPEENSETITLSIGSQIYHLVEEDRKVRNQVLYSEKSKQKKYRCKNKKQYAKRRLQKKGKLMAPIKQDYLCSDDSHHELNSEDYSLYLDGQDSESLEADEVMHVDIGRPWKFVHSADHPVWDVQGFCYLAAIKE